VFEFSGVRLEIIIAVFVTPNTLSPSGYVLGGRVIYNTRAIYIRILNGLQQPEN